MLNNKTVNIIGAGLAGCEAAIYLANHGVKVNLYEMKTIKKTPAQHMQTFAELVCSNSLKSTQELSASGMLKNELELLGSFLLSVANQTKVPSGNSLSVDREKFSQTITKTIKQHKNIQIIEQVVEQIDTTLPTIIATGQQTAKIPTLVATPLPPLNSKKIGKICPNIQAAPQI